MVKRNNISFSVFIFLFLTVFVVMPFISSCGKSGTVSPSALNVQYQIVNLSPDLGSVDLYINYKKVNTSSYFYPNSSGYFFLTSVATPFQIRPGTSLVQGTVVSTSNIFSIDSVLKPNLKYTLFITGLAKSDSLAYIFTTDNTAPLPAIGRGKVRFLNASPRSQGFDVAVNGTNVVPFSNLQYLKLSNYVELPAGNYDFQIFPHASTTVLKELQNVTIQDGRLYTLYTYGLVGHADSLVFGASVLTNK
ncbi:MAG: DUF4397 domain-containing protein [Mucilaginibacter sp.]